MTRRREKERSRRGGRDSSVKEEGCRRSK